MGEKEFDKVIKEDPLEGFQKGFGGSNNVRPIAPNSQDTGRTKTTNDKEE